MTDSSHLEDQLAEYESASRTSTRWQERLRSWPVYAAAAGAALAHSTAASAAIIYSGPQNITASVSAADPAAIATAPVNIDGIGNIFHLYEQLVASGPSVDFRKFSLLGSFARRVLITHASAPFSSLYEAKRLPTGAIVSSHGIFGGNGQLKCSGSGVCSGPGKFAQGATGFAGIEFTQGGATHFGWVRLKFEFGNPVPQTLTAIDWAYNTTPNAPIDAGQGLVPEPATVDLGLLSAGFVGLLAWRRLRSRSKPEPVAAAD